MITASAAVHGCAVDLRKQWDGSGGKNVLLSISKRGDTYLRTLLIHGARSLIFRAEKKADGWLQRLIGRRNANVAPAALANKNARVVWALLAHDCVFQPYYRAALRQPCNWVG